MTDRLKGATQMLTRDEWPAQWDKTFVASKYSKRDETLHIKDVGCCDVFDLISDRINSMIEVRREKVDGGRDEATFDPFELPVVFEGDTSIPTTVTGEADQAAGIVEWMATLVFDAAVGIAGGRVAGRVFYRVDVQQTDCNP